MKVDIVYLNIFNMKFITISWYLCSYYSRNLVLINIVSSYGIPMTFLRFYNNDEFQELNITLDKSVFQFNSLLYSTM